MYELDVTIHMGRYVWIPKRGVGVHSAWKGAQSGCFIRMCSEVLYEISVFHDNLAMLWNGMRCESKGAKCYLI